MYSNGAISSTPLYSGAFLNQIIKTHLYQKNIKMHIFATVKTGYTVPAAYLQINMCFFNIQFFFYKFA